VELQLLAYLAFTFILVVTPGSTTAVVVRNALRGGREAGLASAAGAAVGNTSHATAAGLGLAIVFARWPMALTALRAGGVMYLAWLGLTSLYRVAKYADGGMRLMAPDNHGVPSPRPTVHGPQAAVSSDRFQRHDSFRQGLVVNLLNPSIATFYLVVVPSFLPGGTPRWYFALLAAIHILMAFVCHAVWAVALGRLRRIFQPPLARRLLEGATGVALLALAVRVLLT
jgi:threonine/homoserine/homoserine lactone efflux protein